MKPRYSRAVARLAGVALLAAVSAGPARADYPATVLSHGPVAYWQFNEAGTSPAPYRLANSGSLGNTGDAFALPTVTNGLAGKVGNAVSFSNPVGTGHLESKADVVYNAALNPKVFSIEFWAKPSSLTMSSIFDANGACPISNFNPNNYAGGRVGWLFYLSPTTRKWNFRLGLTSGYAVSLFATTGLATADTWQHIVATYDSSVVRLYANGVQIASQTSLSTTNGWVPNTGSFLRFGGTPLNGDSAALTADGSYYLPWNQNFPKSGNRGWDGLLDEVAIYPSALSAATVAAHYAAAATPASYGAAILADGPAGYWNFDEAAVTRPAPGSFPVAANAGSLGSAADGTLAWGAVAGQSGPSYAGFPAGNKAVMFDGVNGSMAVNDAPGLHFANTITLAAWVKPTADDYVHDIINHGWDGLGAETFLRITRGDLDGSGNYYEVGATEGAQAEGDYDAVQSPIPAGDIGNWVFLAGTYDGTKWSLYRNGQLVGTKTTVNGPMDVTNSWTIGSRALPTDEDGNRFAGSIDEPAIFTSALSAADILALYTAAQASPVITLAPVNPGIVFKGSTVSFSVLADGAATLAYAWTSNGIATGVTTTNYSMSNIPVGTYTVGVVVTNAFGTNSSSVTFSAVNQPPSITTPPIPAARFVGYPFSLSVVAGGTTPLTYIWSLGGTVLQTGTSSTYSNLASLANAGNYSVIISNETGISVTSAPVALTVSSIPTGYGGAVMADLPIAYWRLGEASGTRAFDSVGGNDGTYNSTLLGEPGFSSVDANTAASFSGPGSCVGNISGTAINFTGHTNFTVEAWVKGAASQSDQATIIAKGIGNTGTTRTEQFALDVSGGVYRFFTTGGNTLYSASAVTGPNGSWQHVVGVYDDLNTYGAETNKLYIFVNGVLEGEATYRPGGLNNTVSPVSIGSKRTGNDPSYDGTFNGTIDEVAVYSSALSAATIQTHYDATYGTTTAPFVSVQPWPTTNYVGLPVTLSVVAAGSPTLTYQWRKGAANIAGADSNTFVIPAAAYGDAGNYTVGITNGVGGTNSVTVPLVVLAPPTNPPAIPGLVVHLPLNNNYTDVTGRGNNGSAVRSPTFVPDGPLTGAALHYSTDSTNVNTANYVTLGVRPDLNFSSNVSFSVAFWIRLPLNYQGGDLPFFTDATNSTFSKGFVFAPTYGFFATASEGTATAVDGGWAFSVFDGSNLGIGGHGPVGSINDGGWHHLVYVLDRTTGSVTYLDGVPSPFTSQQGTSIKAAGDIYTGAPATIGQDPTGNYGEIGSGDIADLGVWRKALTPLEAASIYVAGASNKLSYVGAPVKITSVTTTNNQFQLIWPAGALQAAGEAQGPYTNVPGAVSPYTVTTTGAARMFYRVAF